MGSEQRVPAMERCHECQEVVAAKRIRWCPLCCHPICLGCGPKHVPTCESQHEMELEP